MRAQLKKSIITAIQNNATDFTDAGYEAVKHFDWDRQQWQEEPEKTEHPFLRPAVFIKVEDYEFETRAGRRYAAIPLTLTIVQDYYVDARERSATQQDAYDKSNYSEILNGILDSQQLDCLAKLELTGEGNEEEYGNQLVDTLNYTAHVYQKRNATGKLVTCLPATAIVQDQDGEEITREIILSGATQIITVNVQTMINVAKGDFTGVFDLSVTDQNGFYNDYTEGAIISTLSLEASPKLGSIATVRILGGLLSANAIPAAWDNFSSDAISQDNTQFNVLTILYVANDDVRIVNNVIAAPDFVAPIFTSAPTSTNIAETSFDITAQLNENGTVYGYLLADGSPAPTVQEIIDNAQSQFNDVGAGGTLSFTGLTVNTNYDVYVVAVDTIGNRQADSILVEAFTENQNVVEAISTETLWHKFDIETTDAEPVTLSTDSLQETLFNLEAVGTVNRAVQNGKECIYLNGTSNYMRTVSNDVTGFFNGTHSLSFDCKLEDGQPSSLKYFCGASINNDNRFFIDLRTDGRIGFIFYSNGQRNIRVFESVFIDGAMSDFSTLTFVIVNGNYPLLYKDGELVGVSVDTENSADLTQLNLGTSRFNFGWADIQTPLSGSFPATEYCPSGWYKNVIIQPVAYDATQIDTINDLP